MNACQVFQLNTNFLCSSLIGIKGNVNVLTGTGRYNSPLNVYRQRSQIKPPIQYQFCMEIKMEITRDPENGA